MVFGKVAYDRKVPSQIPGFGGFDRDAYLRFCSESFRFYESEQFCISICTSCNQPSVWVHQKLVWPEAPAVQPSKYLPDEARKAFDEAQKVISRSPQCACAMLRLALERLVVSLGAKGNSLRAKILSLNLSPSIEKLCDACRVVGNDAVHEGTLFVLDDDSYDRAVKLSNFVNWITERTLAAVAQADEILGS